jgi:hypothetical protein
MRNKLLTYISVPAAVLVALLAPAARAQIETFDTISTYDLGGSDSIQGFGSGTALTQTFTDVAELNDMTYQFVSQGSSSQASSITAYLVDWTSLQSGAKGEVSNSSILWSQSFTVPPTNSDSWNTVEFPNNSGTYSAYNEDLSVNTVLNPSDIYAVVMINSTGTSSDLGLEDIYNEYPFTSDGTINGTSYGTAYENTSGLVSSLSYLQTNTSVSALGGVWGFSQIDIVPGGNVIPSPEPRTAALALCGLFVAFLVGRQLYMNRKSQDLLAGATLA